MTPKFADFAGLWDIVRTIKDDRNETTAGFLGTADLAWQKADLSYAESGSLTIDGQQPIHAERRYIWSPAEGGVSVAFEDGRFFHSFDFGTDTRAAHWCDPDQYNVAYDFTNWPDWSSAWSVSGPRKAYTMISKYTRTNT